MQGRFLIFLLAVLVLIGLLIWWERLDHGRPIAGGNGGETIELPPPERLAELLAQHKRGVARAENGQNNLAIEDFEAVAAELPNEVAPVRNIVIVRYLGYVFKPSDELLAKLDEAFARWDELETDRALYNRMLGMKLAYQRQFEPAMEAFNQAVALTPDDPSLWYAVWDAAEDTFKASIKQQGPPAIARAFELQPENCMLALLHAQFQVEAHDAAVVETLAVAEELVQPTRKNLEFELQKFGVDDLEAQFEMIRIGVESGDWQTTKNRTSELWNAFNITDQRQSDTKRVNRHPLEFIAASFAPEVMADVPQTVGSIANDIEVTFSTSGDVLAVDDARDVLLTDANLDGRLDLCLLTGDALAIHWGTEDAGWETGPVHPLEGDFTHFIACDLDTDKKIPFDQSIVNLLRPVSDAANTADVDFVLAGPSGILGLRNDLDPASRECTLAAVDLNSLFESPPTCGGIAAGDFDSDGDMDLLVDAADGAAILWNTENWKFEVQTSEAFNLPEGFRFASADIGDLDRDVDLDIVLSAADGTLGYLECLRHHAFRWRELDAESGVAGSVAVVDLDGNASWDVLSSGDDSIRLHSSQTTGRGAIAWRDPSSIAEDVAADGFLTWDYDNDGRTDLLAWDPTGVRVLRGGEEGFMAGPDIEASSDAIADAAVGDLDLDGDLDAVVVAADGVTTILNEGGNENRWVDILFVSDKAAGDGTGVGSNRVNNNAVGSVIEIRADGVYQAHIIRGQRTHIGLGNAEDIEIVRAIWTNGAPENYLDVEPLQVFAERQTIVTSCPYLYTWNGKEYVWVTDLLWAAPMGLPDPAGGLIPDRHWEYIRIPGDMLAADDGVYRLQMTEELWEASYVDEVRLFAVDHPADVEIHVNEKVGPASIAEHRIYTVSDPRSPLAAINHRGEDVLSSIAAEDDEYLLLHEWRHMQGYTEDTTLELDLGEFDDDAELVLFLSGWIRPADANLHVRLQQDESLPGPQAPRIEIPDGQGGWRELIGYMGYPNGKTKTIAVPLPNEFVDGDHRIRIATSMELYWDQIFFTVNEPAVEVVETQLPLTGADLHYRGVSALVPHSNYGPERYDYARVATEPRFTAMDGKFTRFGDVLDLMTSIDHRLVVFYCGDEITLEFAVPEEPLPEGWVRDFVLNNVGWEKDCNINGVLCRTTEPYPFVGMPSYPYRQELFPHTPEYQEYFDTYQTRELEHLPYLRFVHRFDPNSPDAANPTIVGELP